MDKKWSNIASMYSRIRACFVDSMMNQLLTPYPDGTCRVCKARKDAFMSVYGPSGTDNFDCGSAEYNIPYIISADEVKTEIIKMRFDSGVYNELIKPYETLRQSDDKNENIADASWICVSAIDKAITFEFCKMPLTKKEAAANIEEAAALIEIINGFTPSGE